MNKFANTVLLTAIKKRKNQAIRPPVGGYIEACLAQ